uniref:Uncharacterized protein n=1 Tax=Anguilla anguilla TaxID=7936 RepID=A0A0E9UUN6_ANGAN
MVPTRRDASSTFFEACGRLVLRTPGFEPRGNTN